MSTGTGLIAESARDSARFSANLGTGPGTAIYVATFGPVLVVLVLVWLQPFFPIGELLRDPLAVAELSADCCHVHYGLISNLGVLIWCATSSALLFAALQVFGLARQRGTLVFLIAAALFTAWLMLDDLFLVHEDVLPKLGISETYTYVGYGVLALAYLAACGRTILQARISMLAVAVVLLAASVGIDWLIHSDTDLRLLVEDGAKLAGIAAWCSFHVEAAYRLVAAACRPTSAQADCD